MAIRPFGKIEGERDDRDWVASRYLPAARRALESFPVEATAIELVNHSENFTFRVGVSGGGADYTLRLHRPGYCTIEELESERTWTTHLRDAGIAVPDSVAASGGTYYTLVDIPEANEQRYAGMTTWQDGIPLSDYLGMSSDLAERKRIFHRFGEIAAAMHNQSTGWKPPPDFNRRRLDLDTLLGEDPFWGRFWEHPDLTPSERSLLLDSRDSAREAIETYGEHSGSFSLIHADFTPDNIIYDGRDLSVIDFDDSAFGWHMYDIASILIECRYEPDFEGLHAALMEGYRQHRPLYARDTDMLPVFLLVRGMAIIGWFHQRVEHAGTEHFLRMKEWVIEKCASGVP